MAALLLWWGVGLDAGVLLGLLVRGHWRRAYLLPIVLLATLAATGTIGLCPRCNTWDFWLTKEILHGGLLLLLGVELTLRLCPRRTLVRRRALTWVGIVFAALLVLVATAPPTPLIVHMLPRLIASVIFLYAGLTVILAHHELTLEALPDAVLYGFQFYLVVYVATWGFTGTSTRWAGLLSPLAFNLMMMNLLRVAWQREAHAVPLRAFAAQVRARLTR